MINSFGIDPLMEVRTALLTTTNNDWSAGTTLGGAEINKAIDAKILDAVNRKTDVTKMIARKPMAQLAHIWNIRINLGSTGKAAFYADGAGGTPYPSQKRQLYALAKALRSDYEVSGLVRAAAQSYYDALNDESTDAIDALILAEEKSIICGTATGAYGFSGAYLGLLQLMGSFASVGDTTAVYGVTRASGVTDVDVAVVQAAANNAYDYLTKEDLDDAVDKSDDAGAKGDRRFWLGSTARGSEINRLLQTQQRFVAAAGLMNIEGGFTVTSYKNCPIITSRFMDKNGRLYTGSAWTATSGDHAMYLLDQDYLEFRVLGGVDRKHVPIMGADANQRNDVEGGYFKTYGVFVMKEFTRQAIICNLNAP